MRRTLAASLVLALAVLSAGSAASAQTDVSPSPAPPSSPSVEESPDVTSDLVTDTWTLPFDEPAWKTRCNRFESTRVRQPVGPYK